MDKILKQSILQKTEASDLTKTETVQSLWSGYGEIVRYQLIDSIIPSIIVKHIHPPKKGNHPRGWNTNISHQRKLQSYQVEKNWYSKWNQQLPSICKTPNLIHLHDEEELAIVLEDLDASGYPTRKNRINWAQMKKCLEWLAHFHAFHVHKTPTDLWEVGTYWNLDTRPDELEVLTDTTLKKAAPHIDNLLNTATYQTIVHGDAKLANFCFDEAVEKVSMVDFQYVGGGCGMKDIAYFIGSFITDEECQKYESKILDTYFSLLKAAIAEYHPTINFEALEQEWRRLFSVAWADFHRFLKGWSPGHWKINSYSEQMVQKVISSLP